MECFDEIEMFLAALNFVMVGHKCGHLPHCGRQKKMVNPLEGFGHQLTLFWDGQMVFQALYKRSLCDKKSTDYLSFFMSGKFWDKIEPNNG